MKKGKKVKPLFPIEYMLLMSPRYKEREKHAVTYVALRTVNEFSSFRYEIVVDPVIDGRTLRFNIHGLKAPQLTLPHAGPALYETEIPGLRGEYLVVVSKLDGEENEFSVRISDKEVLVEKSPDKKFIDLVTDISVW